jgi:hypothetical protein
MIRIQSDCYESLPTRLQLTAEMEDQILKTENVLVFPNPFLDQITISSESVLERIELFQASGSIISAVNEISSKEFTLDTNQLLKGIYFLKVTNSKGKEIVKILK